MVPKKKKDYVRHIDHKFFKLGAIWYISMEISFIK